MPVPTGIASLSYEGALLDGEPLAEYFSSVFINMRHDKREISAKDPMVDLEDRIIDFRKPILVSGYVKDADLLSLNLFGFEILGENRAMLDRASIRRAR